MPPEAQPRAKTQKFAGKLNGGEPSNNQIRVIQQAAIKVQNAANTFI
jgi:hypothetical protein